MPVEVLACAVVAHRGARVGVPGGDLHIPQVDAGVETGRERCSGPVEYLLCWRLGGRYSSVLVIAGPGKVCRVA